MLPLPLQFLAAWLAVWLGRVLQRQIDYLKEENRALKEQLGDRKLRLTDATRRRVVSGKASREFWHEFAGIHSFNLRA
jgi:hypothetical protein